jgi:hypothetical protein
MGLGAEEDNKEIDEGQPVIMDRKREKNKKIDEVQCKFQKFSVPK